MGLGFVLAYGYWCTDFLVIQTAMASKNMESARRVPLIAAIPKMFFPFLVVVPGLLAIGLPTPHSTTVTRVENGVIFHEIDVVPPQVEQGQGIGSGKVESGEGQADADGQRRAAARLRPGDAKYTAALFSYRDSGAGIDGAAGQFYGGMAGNVTAFNAVFTYDLYQSYIHKNASDRHYLKMGRWATVGGILLSIGTAYAAIKFNNIMDTLQLVFRFVNAPLFATFLLGMFWKRATGHGAFSGLIAGRRRR